MIVLAGNFRSAAGSAKHVGYFDVPPGEPKVIEFDVRLENRGDTIKVAAGRLAQGLFEARRNGRVHGPGSV